MKKTLTIYFVLITAILLFKACNNGGSNNAIKSPVNAADSKGAKIYFNYCQACHGADGMKGLSGASNLAVSVLTKEEVNGVITNGRRLMVPFKEKLSAPDIDSVTAYVMTLRK